MRDFEDDVESRSSSSDDLDGRDSGDEQEPSNSCAYSQANQSPCSVVSEHSKLLKTFSDDVHNYSVTQDCDVCSNKALLPKTSNISLARSLHKTNSYQDHLCSAVESPESEHSNSPFCLESVSKEELLVLWKSSEIELNRKLEAALREKARLERRLALLQKQSPV